MNQMTCPECGGNVRLASAEGQPWGYRTIPDLELPASVMIPTCERCGESWLDDDTTDAITSVLEPRFRELVAAKAAQAIEVLRRHHRQRVIEQRLGLSGGYLSKLLTAKKTPSPSLVATLLLLAEHPEQVDELKYLWSTRSVGMAIPTGMATETVVQVSAPTSESFSIPAGEAQQVKSSAAISVGKAAA